MQKWRDKLTEAFRKDKWGTFAQIIGVIFVIGVFGWVIGRIGGWY